MRCIARESVPCSFRGVHCAKSFDGLAEVVRAFGGHDPLSGSLFVFRNRNTQRVKILWYAGGGLSIYYKRLERGTFPFPASGEKSVAVSSADLVKLLAGLQVEAHR